MEEILIDNLVIIVICASDGIFLLVIIAVVCYLFWNPLRTYIHTNEIDLEDDDTEKLNVL